MRAGRTGDAGSNGQVTVEGLVEPGFEGVLEAFRANFTVRGEVGAACCLYVQGRKVVDIWGGVADARTGRPWRRDTLALVFSTTKGVTAVCAHLLAQQGQLDLDAPVAEHWPEFGRSGKDRITVRWLLSHRAGLPAIDRPLPVHEALGWDAAVDALAAQRPLWRPGTEHGYHALTFGWLVGEVVRRVTGRSAGQVVATELSSPLGLDLWVGLPEAEEHRVCRLVAASPAGPDGVTARPGPGVGRGVSAPAWRPGPLAQRALNVTDPPFNFNTRDVHAAELPAANGIATARALAKMYAATVGEVDGCRILDQATVARACRAQSEGPDRVLEVDTRFGSGFALHSSFSPMLGPRSFGHPGAGGSLAFADPEAEVGFAYVMNQMGPVLSADPRTTALVGAVRAVTG